ncbi:MAG: hypothetical protein AB2693_33435, partial [Candidatus Thiodiazotropha sp.]
LVILHYLQKLVGNKTSYVHTVGIDNYYLLYEVKVQAYNRFDSSNTPHFGPESPIAYVYSAEGSKYRPAGT